MQETVSFYVPLSKENEYMELMNLFGYSFAQKGLPEELNRASVPNAYYKHIVLCNPYINITFVRDTNVAHYKEKVFYENYFKGLKTYPLYRVGGGIVALIFGLIIVIGSLFTLIGIGGSTNKSVEYNTIAGISLLIPGALLTALGLFLIIRRSIQNKNAREHNDKVESQIQELKVRLKKLDS